MRERPILFSGPMVRAILDGRKTQTRRVVSARKPKGYDPHEDVGVWSRCDADGSWIGWCRPLTGDQAYYDALTRRSYPAGGGVACPYGVPGDRLWVRESGNISTDGDAWMYDDFSGKLAPTAPVGSEAWAREWKRRPSIHMPRWASRLTLDVTRVRVERLRDITEDDAKAEGAGAEFEVDVATFVHERGPLSVTHYLGFKHLWRDINGAASWDANPWVWVLDFAVVTP